MQTLSLYIPSGYKILMYLNFELSVARKNITNEPKICTVTYQENGRRIE